MKYALAIFALVVMLGCSDPPSGIVTDKDTYTSIVYVGKVPVIQVHYRLYIGKRSTTVDHRQYNKCSVGEAYPECKK